MPKIETAELLDRLAKGKPMPGILLLGQESYLRDLCRKAIIEAVLPEDAREWGVVRCDASEDEFSSILALAATPSLLAPRQWFSCAASRRGKNSAKILAKPCSRTSPPISPGPPRRVCSCWKPDRSIND
jgi:hypothetical protein